MATRASSACPTSPNTTTRHCFSSERSTMATRASSACPTSPNTTTRLATPDTSDTTTRLATPAPDTRLVTWQNERKLVKYKCRGPACVATKHMQASVKHVQSENDRGGTDKLTHRNRPVDSQKTVSQKATTQPAMYAVNRRAPTMAALSLRYRHCRRRRSQQPPPHRCPSCAPASPAPSVAEGPTRPMQTPH